MSDAQAAPTAQNGAPQTQEKVEEAPGYKVFAGNLAYSTTDDGLKAFFAPVQSEVLSAQVILRGHRSAGYGFVALSTQEAAQKAVELLNQTELDGRQVIIEIAKPAEEKDKENKERKAKRRPGRRGGKAVPGEVTEAEANGQAAPADGTTGEAAKPKKKKKKPARKPKAVKTDGGDSTPAAAEGDTTAGDAAPKKTPRAKKPKVIRPPRPAGEDPIGEPSKTMLFVANLGFSVDDAGLATIFTDAGITVTSARIVRRRWGKPRRSKGYGFVDVGSEAEQKKAIELLDNKDVNGRVIAVKIAVNTPNEDEETPAAEAAAPEAPAA